MDLSSRIYVAGHTGLVGSALLAHLQRLGYTNLIVKPHRELDLTDSLAVRDFFAKVRPQYVFLAAARVGGIYANETYPADFIFDNLRIQTNVIHESWRIGVERLLFLGSSCIYPKLAPQPLTETSLLSGPLEPTNRSYAVAKIAGIEMCWAYNRQRGTQFLAAMPTNLFGPGDNYHPSNSHLIPALIRKMHEAKILGSNRVEIWGTGTPRRDFLFSADAADACIFLMMLGRDQFSRLVSDPQNPPVVNIGSGTDMTVLEVAKVVAEVVGTNPDLILDSSKPDGTPRKLLDVSVLSGLGWRPRIGLREGLAASYRDFSSRPVASTQGFALASSKD